MEKSLDQRLHAAGCQSTRVRVLASRHADKVLPLISRIEALAKVAEGDNAAEAAFDAICETWYLAEAMDDTEATCLLTEDIARLEELLICSK